MNVTTASPEESRDGEVVSGNYIWLVFTGFGLVFAVGWFLVMKFRAGSWCGKPVPSPEDPDVVVVSTIKEKTGAKTATDVSTIRRATTRVTTVDSAVVRTHVLRRHEPTVVRRAEAQRPPVPMVTIDIRNIRSDDAVVVMPSPVAFGNNTRR